MSTLRSIADADIEGKKVLVRADHNVDIDENGALKSDKKIRATLPTISLLLSKNARVIIMTHVGRPKGKVDHRYSTRKVSEALQALLPHTVVTHIGSTVGSEVEKAAESLQPGHILYLENVRFLPEEEGDPAEQKMLGRTL